MKKGDSKAKARRRIRAREKNAVNESTREKMMGDITRHGYGAGTVFSPKDI